MKLLVVLCILAIAAALWVSKDHFSLYPEHIISLITVDKLPTWTAGSRALNSSSGTIGVTALGWHPRGIIVCNEHKTLLITKFSSEVIGGPSHGAVYADGVIYTVHENGLYRNGTLLYFADKPIVGVTIGQSNGCRSSLPLDPFAISEKVFRGRRVWVPDNNLFTSVINVGGLSMNNLTAKYLTNMPVERMGKVDIIYLPEPDQPSIFISTGNHAEPYIKPVLPDEHVIRGQIRLVDPGMWSSPASVMAHQIEDSEKMKPRELGNEYAERFNYAVEKSQEGQKERVLRPVFIFAAPFSYLNDSVIKKSELSDYLDGKLHQLCVYKASKHVSVDGHVAVDEFNLFVSDRPLSLTVDGQKMSLPVGASAVYWV